MTSIDISGIISNDHIGLLTNYDPVQFRNTVNSLANRLENSHTIEQAGKLVIAEVVRSAGDLSTYLTNLDHRLSTRVKSFLRTNFDHYSKLLDDNFHLNFNDHDFFSASTLLKSYLLKPDFGEDPVESPLQMYLRVAVHLYAEDGISAVDNAFFEMANHLYTHASPTLFNGGTKKPQGSSCFLLELGDSLDEILTGVRDAGLISQHKGGLGIGLGRLRHSEISNAGMASGVTPVARILDKMVVYVDQGGARAGAGNVYIPIWHIDLAEFINSTNNFGQSQSIRLQHLNTTIWMNNLFFRRVEEDGKWTVFCPAKVNLTGLYGLEFETAYKKFEVEATNNENNYKKASAAYKKARADQLSHPDDDNVRQAAVDALYKLRIVRRARIDHYTYDARKILTMICDVQIKSGFPFIMNGDEVNKKTNQANIGKINNSNLCVAPETPLLTDKGYFPIKELVDKNVKVWNGDEWSEVTVKKTSDNEAIVRVVFDNGLYIDCTRYHKFLMAVGSDTSKFNPKECARIETSNLRPGARLIKFNYPIVSDDIDITPEEYDFQYTAGYQNKNAPLNASMNARKAWLSGVIDSKASYVNRFETDALIVKSPNLTFLHDLHLIFTMMSTTCSVDYPVTSPSTCLPDSTRPGANRFYRPYGEITKIMSGTLKMHIRNLAVLVKLGVESRLNKLRGIRANESGVGTPDLLRVLGVFETTRSSDVYCFTEPVNKAGMFAGVLTGNCTEICEVSTPETVASCNLASISLKAFAKGPGIKRNEDESVDDFIIRLKDSKAYDFEGLGNAVRSVVNNLDKVITHNLYPVAPKTEILNVDTRPLGIGVSGFDDAVKILDYVFESPEVEALNKAIFACMYFNALVASINLAKHKGEYKSYRDGSFNLTRDTSKPLPDGVISGLSTISNEKIQTETYAGSPASNGFFQFDLWAISADVKRYFNELDDKIYRPEDDVPVNPKSWGQGTAVLKSDGTIKIISDPEQDSYACPTIDCISPDWTDVRRHLITTGLRNSLLLTVMPTASTAQVLRNTESIEAHASNLYTRTVTAGHYIVSNNHLIKDLEQIGLWNKTTIDFLAAFHGSLKHFENFVNDNVNLYPNYDNNVDRLKYIIQKYKTMFEISQKNVLRYSRQRAIYIDQSQSLNIYLEDPKISQVQAVHTMGYKLGLKTGLYYLRQKNDDTSAAFTIPPYMLVYREKVLGANHPKVATPVGIDKTDGFCPIDPVKRAECLSCQ